MIVASNYEDRCREALENCAEALQGRSARSVVWRLTLANDRYVPLLQDMVSTNQSLMAKAADKLNLTHDAAEQVDRKATTDWLKNRLRHHIKSLRAPVGICLDISCMPRDLIWKLLGVLVDLKSSDPSAYSDIALVYTSAARYPRRNAVHIGSSRLYFANEELRLFLRDHQREGKALIFPGNQGTEAFQIWEDLQEFVRLRRIGIHIKHDDPCSGFDLMRQNQRILEEGLKGEGTTSAYYYYTLAQGVESVFSFCADVLSRRATNGEGHPVVLIAPLGPKPLAAAAFLAVDGLRSYGLDADLISISALQFTTVYSLGVGSVSCFALSPPRGPEEGHGSERSVDGSWSQKCLILSN